MRGIGKSFPGVRALTNVSFDVVAGEVHALVGENGAGKSTLMKILAGAQPADEGEILIEGKPALIDGPRAAEQLGIGMIYQEFNLVPVLGAVENIVLGNEPTRGWFLDGASAGAVARAAIARLGVTIPFDVPVSRLSVAQQQMIEIAKALSRRARIIVMDEPTAALTDRETDHLFETIGTLRKEGVAIVYISHRLEELPRIATRVTVLRDGQVIETRAIAAMPQDEMVRLMVGRRLDAHFPDLPVVPEGTPIVLSVRDLSVPPMVNGVSLDVRAGEILGLAGLVGAGRTNIVRAIAGADTARHGSVLIDGHSIVIRNPHDAIEAGIALIPEDRKAQGLILEQSVRENITLPHLDMFSNRWEFVDRKEEYATADRFIQELRIRTPSADQLARNLSGGTQQKVVLAKWLVARAKVLMFDEPTRGIDVGAKAEIYGLMVELLRAGAAIVMVSSELPEVLGMSHRILVVREGRIVKEFSRADASPDKVIAAAAGAAA